MNFAPNDLDNLKVVTWSIQAPFRFEQIAGAVLNAIEVVSTRPEVLHREDEATMFRLPISEGRHVLVAVSEAKADSPDEAGCLVEFVCYEADRQPVLQVIEAALQRVDQTLRLWMIWERWGKPRNEEEVPMN